MRIFSDFWKAKRRIWDKIQVTFLQNPEIRQFAIQNTQKHIGETKKRAEQRNIEHYVILIMNEFMGAHCLFNPNFFRSPSPFWVQINKQRKIIE